MFLKSAKGVFFRNYEKFSLDFTNQLNIFTGDNGQGKSSFLEALYCGLRGRSFYPFITHQIIQKDKSFSQVHLDLEEASGSFNLLARFFPMEKGLKKELFYCDKKTRPSFLSKKIPCFVFTEESMKCIRQGRNQRLIFIDEMLSDQKAKQIKDNFALVLKEKQALLKQFHKGEISLSQVQKLLQALNPTFLKSSFHLVEERLKLLEKLFSRLKQLRSEFFKEPLPDLDFSYSFSKESFCQNTEIFSLLEQDLKEKEEIEMKSGLALSGPHKHEIVFLFNGRDSRTFCSKGQQRIYLLSLLASHIQSQNKGLLLLDDVLLELDEKTKEKFLHFLEKSHCQSFLTNCNIISFKTKNMSFFHVKNGTIAREL